MIQMASAKRQADFGNHIHDEFSELGAVPALAPITPVSQATVRPVDPEAPKPKPEPVKPYIPPGPWANDPEFHKFVADMSAQEAIDFLAWSNRYIEPSFSKGYYGRRSREDVMASEAYRRARSYIISVRKVNSYLESKASYDALMKSQALADVSKATAVSTRNTKALEQIRSLQITLDAAKKQVVDASPFPYFLDGTWMPSGSYTTVATRHRPAQTFSYEPPSFTLEGKTNPVANAIYDRIVTEQLNKLDGTPRLNAHNTLRSQQESMTGPFAGLGQYNISTSAQTVIKRPSVELLASLPPELSTEPGWFSLREKPETVRIVKSGYDDNPSLAFTDKTWTMPANVEAYKKLTQAQREAYLYRQRQVYEYMFQPFSNAAAAMVNRIDAAFSNISKAINNGISEAQKIAKVLKPVLDGMMIVGVAGLAVGAVLSGGTALLASGVATASGAIGSAAGAIIGAFAGPAASLAVSAAVTKYAGEFAYKAVSDVLSDVFGNSPVLKGALAIADYAGSGKVPSADDMQKIADKYAKDIVQKLDAAAQSKLLDDVKARVTNNVVTSFSTELKMSPESLQKAIDGGETDLSPRLLDTLKDLIGQSQSIALVTVEKSTGIKTGAELPYDTKTDILAQISQKALDEGGFADAAAQANLSNMAKALGLNILPAPDRKMDKGKRLLAAELTAKSRAKEGIAAQALEVAAEKKYKEAEAIVRATKDKIAGIQNRVTTATTAETKQAAQVELLTVQEAHKKELDLFKQATANYRKAIQTAKIAQLKTSVLTIAAGQARYYPGFDLIHPMQRFGLLAKKA